MAKDPAFTFYTSDFLTGITFMSNEEAGIYIKLLCYQHQHGGLIDKDDFLSMTEDKPKIQKKFIETSDGFYNERLMAEMVKRQNKSSSLSQNALKRWKGNANAMQMDMPTEDENENERVKKRSFTKPNKEDILKYQAEIKGKIDPDDFIDFYESKGWMVGKNKMKDWKSAYRRACRTWNREFSTSSPQPVNKRGHEEWVAPWENEK